MDFEEEGNLSRRLGVLAILLVSIFARLLVPVVVAEEVKVHDYVLRIGERNVFYDLLDPEPFGSTILGMPSYEETISLPANAPVSFETANVTYWYTAPAGPITKVAIYYHIEVKEDAAEGNYTFRISYSFLRETFFETKSIGVYRRDLMIRMVPKYDTSIILSAYPQKIMKDEEFCVSGFISAEKGKAQDGITQEKLEGVTVTLTYTRPDGSTLTRSVTSNYTGNFTDTYSPDAAGVWEILASWSGDEACNPTVSSSVSFMAEEKPFLEKYGLWITLGSISLLIITLSYIVIIKRKKKILEERKATMVGFERSLT